MRTLYRVHRYGITAPVCSAHGPSARAWKQTLLSENWRPSAVVGNVKPFNDFPGLNMIYPVFSERACEVLGDFLRPNGELLPLDNKVGNYYLYNATRIVDALDLQKSIGEFFPTRPIALAIGYFAFRENELDALLNVDTLDAPFFGSYEACDTVNGAYCMFICCPDVEALMPKLRTWLENLAWHRDVRVMKRFGEIFDSSAKEELVTLQGRSAPAVSTQVQPSPIAHRGNGTGQNDPSVKVSEEALNGEIMINVRGCAGDAAKMLGLSTDTLSPGEVVQAIDTFIYNWQKGKRPRVPRGDDLSLTLGSLWGEQLVRAFGWQWAGVTFHDHGDSRAMGVFSPDRALAIYPTHLVLDCINNNAPV